MNKSTDWIERNVQRMMSQVYVDARLMNPLPTKIVLHFAAWDKFVEILKSKSIFFPDSDGVFKFVGIPVYKNNRLPYGTFTVERFSHKVSLIR